MRPDSLEPVATRMSMLVIQVRPNFEPYYIYFYRSLFYMQKKKEGISFYGPIATRLYTLIIQVRAHFGTNYTFHNVLFHIQKGKEGISFYVPFKNLSPFYTMLATCSQRGGKRWLRGIATTFLPP